MKPGKPGETGQNRAKNRQKTGLFRQKGGKTGKKRAKLVETGGKRQKRAKNRQTEPWRNMAKPKDSPNFSSGFIHIKRFFKELFS